MKNCKNLFLGTALVTLVSLLPAHSFAAPASISTSIEGEEGAFFIAPKWMMGFGGGGKISKVKTTEGAGAEYDIWGGLMKPDTMIDLSTSAYDPSKDFKKNDYSPAYEMSWKSGGLQLGYLLSGTNYSGLRIQLDADYASSYVKGHEATDKNINNTYYAITKAGTTLDSNSGGVVQYKGQSMISGSVDLCYDLVPEGMAISPFGCIGAGVSRISLEDVKKGSDAANFMKLMAQAKVGASYHFTPQIQAFVAGRLRSGIGADEFKGVDIAVSGPDKDKSNFSYSQYLYSYGAEAGLRFIF